MAQAPPVPPDQQSDVIRGEHSPPDREREVKSDPGGGSVGVNTHEQGAPGNIDQNTRNKGRQQDR